MIIANAPFSKTGILILLGICLGYASCFAQWANRKEANLQADVRMLKMIHMKIMTEGDSVWAEKAPDSDPFWFKGYVDEAYLFDREGRTTEYHAYFTDDADDNKTLNLYDKEGKLIEQRFYADRRKTGSMGYEYDNENRISTVIRYDETDNITDLIYHIRDPHAPIPLHKSKNNVWIYTFDLQGRCTEEKCLFPDGRTNFRHIFIYNEDGRQAQMISFDNNNKQQSTNSYRYDADGRVKSIHYVSPVKTTTTRYQFDEFGNETNCKIVESNLQKIDKSTLAGLEGAVSAYQLNEETQAYEKNKSLRMTTETRSVYTYDEKGNWIERYFYINDIPQFMQKREITYWK
ncbi:MAG: hypothetical protein RR346_10790 [Bacteroidales bacterium]